MDSLSYVSSSRSLRGGGEGSKKALLITAAVFFGIGIILLIIMLTRKSSTAAVPVPLPETGSAARASRPKKSRVAHELNSEAEARTALAGAEPVMVFLYADWCGFCKKADPIYAQLAADPEHSNVRLMKLNSAKAKDLAKEKGVSGFPPF